MPGTPIWEIEGIAVNSTGEMASNSLAYKVFEIERHLHSGARWFESAATGTATHIADPIGTTKDSANSFQMDAGNNDWGDWVQILGSDDTPTVASKKYFDLHQIIIEDTERASTYFIQMTCGATGDAGLAANTHTELIYGASVQKETGIIPVQTDRAPVGSLLWARCMCPGQNTGTMNFYIGLHEYEF